MRRVFFWFGVLAATMAAVAIFGFSYLAYRGSRLDKEGQAYAEASVRAITSTWNSQELTKRASLKLEVSFTAEQIASLFSWFGSLGPLAKLEACKGQASLYISTTQQTRMISGQYDCRATYEHGSAIINLGLVKVDDAWLINGFHVNSSDLLPHKALQKS